MKPTQLFTPMISKIILALAFLIVAYLAARFFRPIPAETEADCTRTFPCPMDRIPGGLKQIRIKGIDPALLDKALEEFCTQYELDRKPEILAQEGAEGDGASGSGDTTFVAIDSGIPYITFAYLVNALRYCDMSRKYDVTGWYSMQANEQDGKGLALSHNTLMMYIPEEDEEFDNVCFVTEDGRFFKQTFAGRCPLEQLSRAHRPYEPAA